MIAEPHISTTFKAAFIMSEILQVHGKHTKYTIKIKPDNDEYLVFHLVPSQLNITMPMKGKRSNTHQRKPECHDKVHLTLPPQRTCVAYFKYEQ